MTHKKHHTKRYKIVFPLILVVVIVSSISAIFLLTSVKRDVKNFDLAIECQEKLELNRNSSPKILSDAEESQIRSQLRRYLNKLGFISGSDKSHLNNKFVNEYLKAHTAEELFSDVYFLNCYFNYYSHRSHEENTNHGCYCEKFNVFYEEVINAIGVDIKSFSYDMEGGEGYYSQHPDAHIEPIDNENLSVKADRMVAQTVTYYGDFAISEEEWSTWQDEFLGWENGIFYDQSEGWVSEIRYSLYYKEHLHAFAYSSLSLADFQNEVNNLKIVEIGDNVYKIEYRIDDDTKHKYLGIVEMK